jgi:UDP-GlcNAc3NAcA epimerase
VILRPETEWVELVECGTAIITDANEQKIIEAYQTLSSKSDMQFPKLYGDGKAAEFICSEMLDNL